jgi:hypothetical protein
MANCQHCKIEMRAGNRHVPLPDGKPCPRRGNRSGTNVPSAKRTKDGRARFRLSPKFGNLCARIDDAGLTDAAMSILEMLLTKPAA